MIKYGYEVIPCSKLDINYINQLNVNNYRNKKLVIQVKNTKCIDKEALRYLKNTLNMDIKISVIGSYSDEKVFALGQYHKRMGNYDDAIEYLEEYLEMELPQEEMNNVKTLVERIKKN